MAQKNKGQSAPETPSTSEPITFDDISEGFWERRARQARAVGGGDPVVLAALAEKQAGKAS